MFRFWENIDRVSTSLLTISGVILLPIQIYDLTKSLMAALAIGTIVISALAVSLVRYFYPASGHWRAGYQRYRTESLITERRSTIAIDKHFHATINRCADIIFFQKPRPEDLVDMIDTLPGEQIVETRYASPDSSIKDIRHITPHNLVVYWEPKTDIKPYQPYTHCNAHHSPSLYGPDSFYHSIYFDREVGISRLTIDTHVPIAEAIAFAMPMFQSQVTVRRLYLSWRSGRRRGCEQPTISSSNKIEWALQHPRLGRVYVLLAIYEGERGAFVSEGEKSLVVNRLKDSVQRILAKQER